MATRSAAATGSSASPTSAVSHSSDDRVGPLRLGDAHRYTGVRLAERSDDRRERVGGQRGQRHEVGAFMLVMDPVKVAVLRRFRLV